MIRGKRILPCCAAQVSHAETIDGIRRAIARGAMEKSHMEMDRLSFSVDNGAP